MKNHKHLAALTIELKTARFLVRTLKPENVGGDYVAWFSDPVVKRFITYRPGVDPIRDLKSFVAEHDARADSLLFGVFDPDGTHLANMKYEPIDLNARRAVLGVLIGDRRWRGSGLFQEAFEATSRFLATDLGVEVIALGLSAENTTARRAYERAGFVLDPTTATSGDLLWMERRLDTRGHRVNGMVEDQR